MIPFNKPYFTGKESNYIEIAREKGQLAGNGYFTKLCHESLKERFNFPSCFLTNSATNALEMAVLLCDFNSGDEIILPSYTYVSSATPFANHNLTIKFCDSEEGRPHLSYDHLEKLISKKTKAILVVHYAGIACEIDKIRDLADKNGIILIEDAAHCINAFYKNKALGSFGNFSVFSFHETKNIHSGQGGMLVVNDPKYLDKAEQVWVKGTNRISMERGEVDHYEWTSKGSSFLPSEITAAFLFAQLEKLETIHKRRNELWNRYFSSLNSLDLPIQLPIIKETQKHNYHIFYFTVKSKKIRDQLLSFLHSNGILALFHYLPLHKSPYFLGLNQETESHKMAEFFGDCLIRLPLFYELEESDCDFIVKNISEYFSSNS